MPPPPRPAQKPAETASPEGAWGLVYDWRCPACDLYCRLLRVHQSDGRLGLVNARDDPEVMKEITARGLDIDQGMVLHRDGQFHYGADAIHKLALIASPATLFNRLNIWIFRSRQRAEWLYPVLRACRNLLLKALRRTKINNLGRPGNDRF